MNIGGSFLPSNCPEILKPLDSQWGRLQVFPRPEQDTHELILNDKTVLARHPNGYSCHCLAERMIKGNLKYIFDQADYIIECGGYVAPEFYEIIS